ncbi:tetratricopeptide repeat protein [Vibrio maerlii]|uniref:tetratricopeptide repeat protein n=1 Tax=Vibrio maerlii TaxID=2231648 RepID=UPI0013DF779E|nr:tetratricopeptide repeat protein [Vibrio maerlii]
MDTLVIAIAATGLSLILVFVWMVSLSLRKKRIQEERKAKEVAYRRAIEKARKQEQEERVYKADTGHIPSILVLAKEAERSNIREALYWYEKAALLDNRAGMTGIIRISEKRRDDMVLKGHANFWRTCIQALDGNIDAKFEMGKAYAIGRGVDKQLSKGLIIIREVANEGYSSAMIYLGDWALSVDNPNSNPEEAAQWFYKAALDGNAEGKIKLAECYQTGKGVLQSHVRCSYWLENAAEKGSSEAMYRAGLAWAERSGEQAKSIAYIWLFLASQFGSEESRSVRDKVAHGLGIDSVVGLQALAKPILQKLNSGTVSNHSIIKAFNKLYKRESYFPDRDGHEFAEKDEAVTKTDEQTTEASS